MREEKSKSKRKTLIITISLILVLVVSSGIYFFVIKDNDESQDVFVISVADITGKQIGFSSNRYMGVVESQEIKEISLDQSRELEEVYVELGDNVKVGDILFSYSTAEVERRMLQATIEIEGLRNNIRNCYTEISALENEKANAGEEFQIDYTLQIQSLYASIAQTEYSIKTKQVEYDQLKVSIENSVVKAPIDGSIQSINDPKDTDPYTGMSLPFIVIMKGGDFVIRGTVSELNIYSIYEGSRVIIRSRIDEEKTWGGTILRIETNKVQEDNKYSYMYYSPSGSEGASKYDFYVEIDSINGLMIGQHVTIELDMGTTNDKQEGLWLPSWYINDIEGDSFVWADNSKGRLEARKVVLGAYDDNLDYYEIVRGLSISDYIAYGDSMLKAGQRTTKEQSFDFNQNDFDNNLIIKDESPDIEEIIVFDRPVGFK